METQTYILPAYWASGLMNNDWTGCAKLDKAEAEKFLSDKNLPGPVSCSDDQYFKWGNDANNIGGDVLEFTFLVNEPD